MIDFLYKIYWRTIFLASLAFISLYLCAPTRIVGFVFVILPVSAVGMCVLRGGGGIRYWIAAHDQLIFYFVLMLGLVFRIFLAITYRDLNQFYISGDSAALFQKIEALTTSGVWIQNKSWTSVIGYTFFSKLFSLDYRVFNVVNVGIYVVVEVLGYLCLRKYIGKIAGLFLSLYYALNISLTYSTLYVSCEQFYFIFIVSTLWCLLAAMSADRRSHTILCALGTGSFVWLAIWARSDGMVLLLAILFALAIRTIFGKGKRYLLILLGVFCSSFVFGCLSYYINTVSDGSQTIFCSNDNYIPRMVGVNFETKGRCSTDGSDLNTVMERFLAEHPEKAEIVRNNKITQPLPYINDLLPYIKEEISSRKKNLTLGQWIELILSKEKVIFWYSTGFATMSGWWKSFI